MPDICINLFLDWWGIVTFLDLTRAAVKLPFLLPRSSRFSVVLSTIVKNGSVSTLHHSALSLPHNHHFDFLKLFSRSFTGFIRGLSLVITHWFKSSTCKRVHSNARSSCMGRQLGKEQEGRWLGGGGVGGRKHSAWYPSWFLKKELRGIYPLPGSKFCKSSLYQAQKEWAHSQRTQEAYCVFLDTWLAGLNLSFHFLIITRWALAVARVLTAWLWLMAHDPMTFFLPPLPFPFRACEEASWRTASEARFSPVISFPPQQSETSSSLLLLNSYK